MTEEGYKHKITAEASNPEGKLRQRITFEQFYDTKEQQVENQERLFVGALMGTMEAAKDHRDANVG